MAAISTQWTTHLPISWSLPIFQGRLELLAWNGKWIFLFLDPYQLFNGDCSGMVWKMDAVHGSHQIPLDMALFLFLNPYQSFKEDCSCWHGMENGCSLWFPSNSLGYGPLPISWFLPIVQRRLVLLEWKMDAVHGYHQSQLDKAIFVFLNPYQSFKRRLVLLEWNEKWIQFMVTIIVNWSKAISIRFFFQILWMHLVAMHWANNNCFFSQFFVKFSEKSIQKKIPFRSSLMISLRCMCSKLWMYNNDEDDDVNSIILKDIFVHLRSTIRTGKQQFGQHIKILYGILLFEPTSLKYWSNSLKS